MESCICFGSGNYSLVGALTGEFSDTPMFLVTGFVKF